MQERLESSSNGRAAISVFIAVTVASLVFWNLPDSEIRDRSMRVVRPYVLATGLSQNWGVFAPDPRRDVLELFARVRFADGSEETLGVPRGNRVFGSYWDYRWRKWAEWTRTDSRDFLWQPAAIWFARRARATGSEPVEVTLVRRWRELLPPGPGPSMGDWQEYEFYTYDVRAARGEGAQT